MFLSDSGTPAKNIPPLAEVDDGDTVTTCRAIHFSSCIYPSVAASTISDIILNSASSMYYTLVTYTIGSQHTYKI